MKTKFKIGKTYRTRGGGAGKIYGITESNGKYPLWGYLMHPGGGGETERWAADGLAWWGVRSGSDLTLPAIGEEAPAHE